MNLYKKQSESDELIEELEVNFQEFDVANDLANLQEAERLLVRKAFVTGAINAVFMFAKIKDLMLGDDAPRFNVMKEALLIELGIELDPELDFYEDNGFIDLRAILGEPINRPTDQSG